jgi:hypothetical protein
MVCAMTADRSLRVPLSSARRLDAHYRRGAAIVALVFPLAVPTFLIVGLARNGPGSLATHPLLVLNLPTGFAAILFWMRRYSRSAVSALCNSGDPITVRGESIKFFGRTFPLSETSGLLVERKKISLLNEDHVLAVEPTFFVKSDAWDLNR